MNANETAKKLIEDGFPISKYEAIQAERKRRMVTWKEMQITELIYNEAKLIKFGNKVLRLMWEHAIYKALRKNI